MPWNVALEPTTWSRCASACASAWEGREYSDSFVFQWPGGCATSQARGGTAGGRGPSGHSESQLRSQ